MVANYKMSQAIDLSDEACDEISILSNIENLFLYFNPCGAPVCDFSEQGTLRRLHLGGVAQDLDLSLPISLETLTVQIHPELSSFTLRSRVWGGVRTLRIEAATECNVNLSHLPLTINRLEVEINDAEITLPYHAAISRLSLWGADIDLEVCPWAQALRSLSITQTHAHSQPLPLRALAVLDPKKLPDAPNLLVLSTCAEAVDDTILLRFPHLEVLIVSENAVVSVKGVEVIRMTHNPRGSGSEFMPCSFFAFDRFVSSDRGNAMIF